MIPRFESDPDVADDWPSTTSLASERDVEMGLVEIDFVEIGFVETSVMLVDTESKLFSWSWNENLFLDGQPVVYFDQGMHAHHMVENNEKRLKITQKVLFLSYTRETYVRLT